MSTSQAPNGVPKTSNERLNRSHGSEKALTLEALEAKKDHWEDKNETVLYLAYGSNLCYATFQKSRGIRPISQVNVVVPSLRLTFDLAGLPYLEPCFGNCARREPGKQGYDVTKPDYHKDRWKKGLVGVVYEVTLKDYAHIIATEGGGSSYEDIVVDCHPLGSSDIVPEIPTGTPFKAHTLFVAKSARPDPSYAQPSARYLKLITDGAAECGLPAEYQSYLNDIRSYTITSLRQRVGAFTLLAIYGPVMILLRFVAPLFADKNGKSPMWMQLLFKAIFKYTWSVYDLVWKSTFGDGERTEYKDDDLPDGETTQLLRKV